MNHYPFFPLVSVQVLTFENLKGVLVVKPKQEGGLGVLGASLGLARRIETVSHRYSDMEGVASQSPLTSFRSGRGTTKSRKTPGRQGSAVHTGQRATTALYKLFLYFCRRRKPLHSLVESGP